jgi:hypothetical protein
LMRAKSEGHVPLAHVSTRQEKSKNTKRERGKEGWSRVS